MLGIVDNCCIFEYTKKQKTIIMTFIELLIQNSKLDTKKKYYFGKNGTYLSWDEEFLVWCAVKANGFGITTSRDFNELKKLLETK